MATLNLELTAHLVDTVPAHWCPDCKAPTASRSTIVLMVKGGQPDSALARVVLLACPGCGRTELVPPA